MKGFSSAEQAKHALNQFDSGCASDTIFMAKCTPLILEYLEMIAKKKVIQVKKVFPQEVLGIDKIIEDAKAEINRLQDSTSMLDNPDKIKVEVFNSTIKIWRALQEIQKMNVPTESN